MGKRMDSGIIKKRQSEIYKLFPHYSAVNGLVFFISPPKKLNRVTDRYVGLSLFHPTFLPQALSEFSEDFLGGFPGTAVVVLTK